MRNLRAGFAVAAVVLAALLGFDLLGALGGVAVAASVGTTSGIAGNVNEAMKVIFEEPLTRSIVSDSELLDCFEQDMNVQVNQTTGGRYIELAHYFTLPAGVGARQLEGDYIPVPEGPVIENSQIYLKKIEGVVQMTGDTMRRVKQGEGAWLTWARRHLPSLKERVDHEIDRMLLGYGAGIRARVQDADPDANDVIELGDCMGVANLEGSWKQFMEQESVVFGPNADATALRDSGQAYRITDVDPAAGTITLASTPSANVSQNDYIFGGDAAGHSGQASGTDRELMGLLGMVDDGGILSQFQGLTRANYRPWRSQIFDASVSPYGGALTEELLTKADDRTFVRGDGEIDKLLVARVGARNFWANLKDDKRLIDPRAYTGGKSALGMVFGDRQVDIKVIRKMPGSLCFGLESETFKHWRNTGWEWDDTTGSLWHRVTDGTGRKDTFYAKGHLVMQTGCVNPQANFRIENLDTSY